MCTLLAFSSAQNYRGQGRERYHHGAFAEASRAHSPVDECRKEGYLYQRGQREWKESAY
jgi:hypothetical protein